MPRAHRRWDSSATLSRSARSPSEALRGAGRGRSRDRAEAIRHDISRASDPIAAKTRRFMEGIGDERCAISILCPQARRTWPATSASPIRLQLDIPTETKRGERGIIVRGASGQRIMLEATWGFPRPQKDRGGELLHHEPVNLIADLTNPMWSSMVPDPRYRCLIPARTARATATGSRSRLRPSLPAIGRVRQVRGSPACAG